MRQIVDEELGPFATPRCSVCAISRSGSGDLRGRDRQAAAAVLAQLQ
jgi:hypothetical protein